MSFFARKPYKSEVSMFIDELKAKKPSLESRTARRPRAAVGPPARPPGPGRLGASARVPQQPYVYQTKTD